MANVDLHGVEFKRIDSPQSPLSVGLSTTVGLVGAAPDAAGEEARTTVGAGDSAFQVAAADVGEDGDDISVAVKTSAASGTTVAVDGKAISVTAAENKQAKLTIGAGDAALTFTANAAGPWRGGQGNNITVTVTTGAAGAGVSVAGNHNIQIETASGGSSATAIATMLNGDAEVAALVAVVDGGDGTADVADKAKTSLAGGVDATTATDVVGAINGEAAAHALVTASLPAGSDGSGEVGAAPQQSLSGGVDPELEPNTPSLLGAAAQIAALGDAGSLPAAVRDVLLTAGRGGAAIVVVRTEDDTAGGLAGRRDDRSGVWALLDAESVTGQRPRLLAAPGAQDAAITTALEAVAAELRAVAVVTLDAATAAAAVTASPDSPHVLACWPELMIADGAAESRRPADALAVGHVVRTDREASFAASPSNRIMLGVLRPAVAVEWALSSRTTAANTLNQGNVVTFVRRGNNVYLWGNRLADGELLVRRRADEIIGDQVAGAVLDYLDRRVDLPFVEHVLGRVGGYIRNLATAGHIRAGRVWFDPAFNTRSTLAAGQVTFSYEITPHEIAEMITFRASIGSVPSEVLSGLEG